MRDDNTCIICEGKKTYLGHPCTFCNGTGEWNQPAENYLKDHICQCIIWGREFCPICGKKCHHDSHQTPKQKIDPGYDGTTSSLTYSVSNTDTNTISVNESQEVVILA